MRGQWGSCYSAFMGRLRVGIALAVLALQLVGVVRAHLGADKYFAWAIFDTNTRYVIGVTIAGRALSEAEVRARYRIKAKGIEGRSIRHVFDVVRHYEATHGRGQGAEVVVRYRIDEAPEETWRWPG